MNTDTDKAPCEIYQLARSLLSSISLTDGILQDGFRQNRGLLLSFSIAAYQSHKPNCRNLLAQDLLIPALPHHKWTTPLIYYILSTKVTLMALLILFRCNSELQKFGSCKQMSFQQFIACYSQSLKVVININQTLETWHGQIPFCQTCYNCVHNRNSQWTQLYNNQLNKGYRF